MSRVERWEHAVEWPLVVAAFAFLTAYAIPIVDPEVDPAVRDVCTTVLTVTWIAFALDYAVRLVLSDRRWAFVRSNVLDLAVIALPVLRPLRLLRLIALVAVLNRAGANSLRGRVVTYVIGATTLLVVCGALAVTEAERGHPGATIEDVGDGLWWAATTITTVGYGDRYPVTTTGRFVAAALMISGIALLGVVTATLASWLVERVTEAGEQERAATHAQVSALHDEVLLLRAELAALRTSGRTDDDPA
ncbi:potassium channel family protein [Cellulomonas alba]|uniref:Ion channel n=1 Tax=Cellulomonas alba TaxID=3053467 RepID=A0ABT7SEF7_9CELL|nr:potassium channel family protein [Cellulomonas alba]MDM7854576.1 ion channel [Cellulomonas alba]